MRQLSVLLFTFLLVLSLSAIAQDSASQSSSSDQQGSAAQAAPAQSADQGMSDQSASKAKLEHLKGKISDDGKSFTSNKDNKSWTIVNPDAVKGHEGHDVRVSAHVYPDKDAIHVMSVKMAGERASKKSGTMSEQPPQQ
jgi:hypothetical protein